MSQWLQSTLGETHNLRFQAVEAACEESVVVYYHWHFHRVKEQVMNPAISLPAAQLAEFCQRNQIRKLALFGSVLRRDFRPDSDIDVLVEFEPDAHIGWEFIDIQDELSQLLRRSVDLHTYKSLNPYFRNKVLPTAEVIYERTRPEASTRHAHRSPTRPKVSAK
jgi:predicted nucleotidyltransferase